MIDSIILIRCTVPEGCKYETKAKELARIIEYKNVGSGVSKQEYQDKYDITIPVPTLEVEKIDLVNNLKNLIDSHIKYSFFFIEISSTGSIIKAYKYNMAELSPLTVVGIGESKLSNIRFTDGQLVSNDEIIREAIDIVDVGLKVNEEIKNIK